MCWVLPTKKVQSRRTCKHLRLPTGTPCLTEEFKPVPVGPSVTFSEMLTVAPGAGTELLSLPCADGDSDTAEPVLTRGPGQPTFWNQTNNDSGAPPTVLHITIPAQCEENTMRVIGPRRGPTRTEGSVPTGAATAIPRFTQGLQGSVCGNAFPLLTLQKRAISKCWGALAPNPHQAPNPHAA